MPDGYEEIDFNMQVGDALRRGATEYGNKIFVWKSGYPIELSHRDKDKFRSFYERCDDTDLCDEVMFNFEHADSGYHLTTVRFGGPLLSTWSSTSAFRTPSTDRCDTYKELARELWDEPTHQKLEGRLEVFEINDRVWGAVLCTEVSGGELFVAKFPRIEEMYD